MNAKLKTAGQGVGIGGLLKASRSCVVGVSLKLAILAIACSGCATDRITNGIPNLAQVQPGLYRGGQPNADGWAWLRARGITNVVKLNTDEEGSDAEAVRLGMTVHRQPVSKAQQLGLERINPYLFDGVAALMILPGTYVHCEHGQDRTGLAVACYRASVQRWSKADAQKEMLELGFHKSLLGLWDYWEHFNP